MHIRIPKDSFDKSFGSERKPQLPVRAPSEKLRPAQNSKTQYLVKCVSSIPLATDTTKEQIRMNYIHNVIQGKINDPRFCQSVGLPKLAMNSNPSSTMGMASSQFSTNPFIKSINACQPQSFQTSNIPQPLGPTNQGRIPQNNNSMTFSNSNPFITKQNQSENNPSSNQLRNNSGMASFVSPMFSKQTSFNSGLNTSAGQTSDFFGNPQSQQSTSIQQSTQPNQGVFGNPTTTGNTFGGLNAQLNPFALNPQVPGQLTSSPSFGNLNQSGQPMTTTFGQQNSQFGQNTLFGSKPANQIFSSQTPALQASSFAPLNTPPNTQPQVSLLSQNGQSPVSKLDKNIQDLLASKPNLWNILSLDPEYRNGFNECGRMYVKSVLQRIIDENILSEDSLNKIIIEIYKQMYGPENFQKILQNKKSELHQDEKITNWKISELLGKQFNKKMSESIFPKEIDSIGEDFYRSFKRRSTKLFDKLPFSMSRDQNQYERRLQRKYIHVKRPKKAVELQVKFIEVDRHEERAKVIESPFDPQSLDKIADTLNDIRTEHRRQIMLKQEELPIIQGFTISPTLQEIRRYTKYELQSVPKVTISNEWGYIRFKTPISLLNKNLAHCLVINQKSVEIIDEQWKVRNAQIAFKKFTDFTQLDENDQEALENHIIAWCEKQKMELLKIDRARGQVVIEI